MSLCPRSPSIVGFKSASKNGIDLSSGVTQFALAPRRSMCTERIVISGNRSTWRSRRSNSLPSYLWVRVATLFIASSPISSNTSLQKLTLGSVLIRLTTLLTNGRATLRMAIGMKAEALIRDSVFQLNILLWMAKEQPTENYRVRPLFFELRFRIIYIEQPFPLPEEMASDAQGSSLLITLAPEPELILGRDS